MKKTKIAIYVLLASFFAVGFVHAHDPSLHKEKMEKPKCEAIKNIDHSKMDENDPVMLAMMKKCKSAMDGDENHAGHSGHKVGDKVEPNQVNQHKDRHNH
jgi:hypothetical protein